MNHLPFMAQMALGMAGREDEDADQRVARPNSKTPATFSLNWNYCENGPSDPRPADDVVTFMGPPITAAAGDGKGWPQNHVLALKMAVQTFRQAGLVFEAPEDYDGKDEDEEKELSKAEHEADYFKNEYYNDMELCNQNKETVVTITRNSDWLVIRCANADAAKIVTESEALKLHFALAEVPHTESTIWKQDDLVVKQRTGNGGPNYNRNAAGTGTSLSTMFELLKAGKLISKCLLSYQNGEMDNVGPTIEQFETAAQWRRHGYATQLLEAMEEHLEEDMFQSILETKRVKFNVCYVTSFAASQWFQNRGFSDWDGMGEELGKYLGEE